MCWHEASYHSRKPGEEIRSATLVIFGSISELTHTSTVVASFSRSACRAKEIDTEGFGVSAVLLVPERELLRDKRE